MLRDLVQHKAWASAALLTAIRNSDTAADDDGLRTLLHHILLANRFWLFLIQHHLVHAVWRPLVELTRLRHVKFRQRLAAADLPHSPGASVVTAGV